MRDENNLEIEEFITDWYYDDKSHKYAQDLCKYLFDFIDYLEQQGLKDKTIRRHLDNCWSIGILECSYGYRDVFFPGEVFNYPEADYVHEFRRKHSDSQYALQSYEATWKKLYKYTKTLGHLDDD